MEEIFRYLGDNNDLWGECSLTNNPQIHVSEISSDATSSQEICVHKIISRESLEEWLKDGTKRPCSKKSCKTGSSLLFRIVWIEHTDRRCDDIDSTSLDQIVTAFNLELATRYYGTAFAGVTAFPPKTKSATEHRSYSFSYHPKLALLWSHDTTSHLTQAICFAGRAQISKFRQMLEVKWRLVDQEMMIAFLCSLLLSGEVDFHQSAIKQEVREVEVRTGYHRWTSRQESPASGDLAALSAKMSGCGTKMASCARKVKVVQEMNEFILEQLQEQQRRQGNLGPPLESHRLLENNIKLVQRRAKMQRLDTEFFQNRISIQITAVRYSLQQP